MFDDTPAEDLTDEQLRAAIADKVMGWEKVDRSTHTITPHSEPVQYVEGMLVGINPGGEKSVVPDYLKDPSAMNAVLARLRKHATWDRFLELGGVPDPSDETNRRRACRAALKAVREVAS